MAIDREKAPPPNRTKKNVIDPIRVPGWWLVLVSMGRPPPNLAFFHYRERFPPRFDHTRSAQFPAISFCMFPAFRNSILGLPKGTIVAIFYT